MGSYMPEKAASQCTRMPCSHGDGGGVEPARGFWIAARAELRAIRAPEVRTMNSVRRKKNPYCYGLIQGHPGTTSSRSTRVFLMFLCVLFHVPSPRVRNHHLYYTWLARTRIHRSLSTALWLSVQEGLLSQTYKINGIQWDYCK